MKGIEGDVEGAEEDREEDVNTYKTQTNNEDPYNVKYQETKIQ